MARIIQFPAPPEAFNAGNGAREALDAVLDMGDGAADIVLCMLWYRGFKVVTLDGSEGD